MSTRVTELAPPDEGGDDRNAEVEVAKLREMYGAPAAVKNADITDVSPNETVPPTEPELNPKKPEADTALIDSTEVSEGARMIYSRGAPQVVATRGLGIVLGASDRFRPAGTEAIGKAAFRHRYGVYQSQVLLRGGRRM